LYLLKMTKKNLILLLVLILLPLAYFLLKRNVNSNMALDKDYFAVKNLEKIDKIFISNSATREYATVAKGADKVWRVNDNWIVNEVRLQRLLATARDLEIKYQVDEDVRAEIMKQLAATGMKTMFYSNGKLIKSYFVGNPTVDMLSTYIVEEGSDKPYVVHIPGFNGYQTPSYFTDSVEWRNKNIFNIPAKAIKEVKVEWAEKPYASFSIIQAKGTEGNIVMQNAKGEVLSDVNELKVKAFLNIFTVYEGNNLACEGFHKNFGAARADSIAASPWFYRITVIEKNGKQTTLKLYKKPIQVNTYSAYDENGNPLNYEIDKYWGVQNNEPLIMEIQDLIFSKIMREAVDFK